MGDTKTEILEAVKVLLRLNDSENDELILLLIDEVTDAVLSYCHLEVLPRQLAGFIPTLAADRFNFMYNGGVKSVTEGERRVEYIDGNYDFLAKYEMRLRPFVSRKAFLPSDIAREGNSDDESV